MQPSLGANTLIDLALLGLVMERPRALPALTASIRTAGGAWFKPTAALIEDRLLDLMAKGLVERRHARDEISPTAAAAGQILRLLRLELDPSGERISTFCASLNLCFLDLVDAETCREIARALCAASECCPDGSGPKCCDRALRACPMMTRHLAIEQKRRADEERWLDDILLEEGILDPAH